MVSFVGQPAGCREAGAGRNRMGELTLAHKSFEISKTEVWDAYRQVRANRGAPGVDGQTLAAFETDLESDVVG
jgi:hypothetical protein